MWGGRLRLFQPEPLCSDLEKHGGPLMCAIDVLGINTVELANPFSWCLADIERMVSCRHRAALNFSMAAMILFAAAFAFSVESHSLD